MFRRIHSQVARKIVAEIFCALLEGQSDTFWWLGRILFLLTTITIGQFLFAAKEVKSRLRYLNENPLILIHSKKILYIYKKIVFVSILNDQGHTFIFIISSTKKIKKSWMNWCLCQFYFHCLLFVISNIERDQQQTKINDRREIFV